MDHDPITHAVQLAIQDNLDCYRACLETHTYCLKMDGKYAEPAHLRLLLDCSAMCKTTSNFILRQSEFSGEVSALSAEISLRCGEMCERINPNDEQFKLCAHACRQASEASHHIATSQIDPVV